MKKQAGGNDPAPQVEIPRGGAIRRVAVNMLMLTLPSLLVLGLVLELFFRTLIPGSSLPYTYFDPVEKILRFDPTGPRNGICTRGKLAQQRGRWRINDEGWNSTLEYLPAGTRRKSLVSIIGDSYVEALSVDVDNNLSAVLGELLGSEWEVYSFGISGAPLSQYLNVSRYVARRFAPDIMVFLVLHNDFDESVAELERTLHFLQLSIANNTVQEVMPIAYPPSVIRRIAVHSALIRYLWFNLRAQQIFDAQYWQQREQNFNANIDVDAVSRRHDVIQRATDYVVGHIVKENPGVPVVFMMDAPRRDIYEDRLHESDVLWLHDMIGQSCATYGALFIDLSEPFQDAYRTERKKFNTEYDFHWNNSGHELAADTLYERMTASGLLQVEWSEGE